MLCAGSYPEMTAFQEVVRVLNVAQIWVKYNDRPGRQSLVSLKKRQVWRWLAQGIGVSDKF